MSIKDRIKKIDKLTIDYNKFPYEINSFAGNNLIKQWTFIDKKEAFEAYQSIWAEIQKAKGEAKK
jgi:hypothetical protein